MRSIILGQKAEKFDKKDFGAFMQEVAAQAEQLDVEEGPIPSIINDLSFDDE